MCLVSATKLLVLILNGKKDDLGIENTEVGSWLRNWPNDRRYARRCMLETTTRRYFSAWHPVASGCNSAEERRPPGANESNETASCSISIWTRPISHVDEHIMSPMQHSGPLSSQALQVTHDGWSSILIDFYTSPTFITSSLHRSI